MVLKYKPAKQKATLYELRNGSKLLGTFGSLIEAKRKGFLKGRKIRKNTFLSIRRISLVGFIQN